jgi:hypothetical protein
MPELPRASRVIRVTTVHALARTTTTLRVQLAADAATLHVARSGGVEIRLPPSTLTGFEANDVARCVTRLTDHPPVLDVQTMLDGSTWLVEVFDGGKYVANMWNSDNDLADQEPELIRCRNLVLALH